MKHCIIAKFNESVVDKPAAIESVKALFASAAPIEGVNCRGDGEGRPAELGRFRNPSSVEESVWR